MSWAITADLITGGSIATGSAALLLAAWMAMRLRNYRSAGSGETPKGGARQMVFAPFLEDLLSDEDFQFLAALPGYRPEIGKKLRRDRERIYRLYLDEIAREFHRIHAEARAIVANSGEEYAGAVGVLMHQQWMFWQAMARIELSLWAGRFGSRRVVTVRRAALAGLMETMRTMRDMARRSAAAV